VSDVQVEQIKPRLFDFTTISPFPKLNEMRLEFPQFDVSVAADDEQFGADRGE